MSWITLLWVMEASVSLTLAGIYLLVWFKQGERWGHLFFSLGAVGAAAVAACEYIGMHSKTVEQYGTVLRWAQVPLWVLIISVLWFAHFHMRAGRLWLAWAVMGTRTLALVLGFVSKPNLNYTIITGLRHVQFMGESVVVAEGRLNPWVGVGRLNSLLLLIFLVDASVTVWRRGERKRALLLGGSMIFFVIAGASQAALVQAEVIQMPYLISFSFLGIVLVMSYESSRDVLRAARLAADLQESQEILGLAAKASGLAVWNWDIARNAIRVTNERRALYGVSPHEEITFDRFLATLHPDDLDSTRREVERSMAGDGNFLADYRVALPDGLVRWVTARGRVEFHGGKPWRMHGVSLDITERKEAELEALQHRNELAHLSRVTMLGELSGSLAHELNQPLTAILSNAQAALRFLERDSPDLSELRDILVDIVSEDQRAGEVIHRLRLLLKKGEVQQQPLDANEIVQDVLKLVHSDLVNQDVTVDTDLAQNLSAASGDRVQLQQVLLNLVMNACDAMVSNDPPDRRITVRTRTVDDGWLRIEVSDFGRGLPPGGAERVFEPFFTTKSHGMGLGLSVCRTIITAHGGSFGAGNNADRGATFHFILPMTREDRI